MEKEKAKLDEKVAAELRDARHEADQIIAAAHKDARQVVRDAEKAAATRAERIIEDAEARISEETEHAKRKLEKDLVGLVSEATETIVGEKVDAKKDAELVKKALKGRK
jgi:F-type H+-transporting ATPase subunit b